MSIVSIGVMMFIAYAVAFVANFGLVYWQDQQRILERQETKAESASLHQKIDQMSQVVSELVAQGRLSEQDGQRILTYTKGLTFGEQLILKKGEGTPGEQQGR